MSESNEANLGFSHIVVVSTATYLPVYCKDKRTCSNNEMKSAQDIMAATNFLLHCHRRTPCDDIRWKTFYPRLRIARAERHRANVTLASVASVSVRFRRKERGTRVKLVKDREKSGASKRAGRGWGRKEGNACRQTPGFWKPPTWSVTPEFANRHLMLSSTVIIDQ